MAGSVPNRRNHLRSASAVDQREKVELLENITRSDVAQLQMNNKRKLSFPKPPNTSVIDLVPAFNPLGGGSVSALDNSATCSPLTKVKVV